MVFGCRILVRVTFQHSQTLMRLIIRYFMYSILTATLEKHALFTPSNSVRFDVSDIFDLYGLLFLESNHLLRSTVFHDSQSLDTNIAFELPRGEMSLEHLIQFFESPVFGLRQEDHEEGDHDEARNEPNPAILGTPIKGSDVDEIRSCERDNPSEKEPNR